MRFFCKFLNFENVEKLLSTFCICAGQGNRQIQNLAFCDESGRLRLNLEKSPVAGILFLNLMKLQSSGAS